LDTIPEFDFMEEKDVIDLYLKAESLGIKLWVDGGWGVDALLGKQTRPHKDLDITIQSKDLSHFCQLLSDWGYRETKPEIARSHNFVLSDAHNREIDIHVIVLNERGDGIYGPIDDGVFYPAASLTGKGTIGNIQVDCISPEYVVKFHSGYSLQEKDFKDVTAICRKFNLEIPPEFSH
jgi:lincosamide nucleotidyltransferase A/C/D/E